MYEMNLYLGIAMEALSDRDGRILRNMIRSGMHKLKALITKGKAGTFINQRAGEHIRHESPLTGKQYGIMFSVDNLYTTRLTANWEIIELLRAVNFTIQF